MSRKPTGVWIAAVVAAVLVACAIAWATQWQTIMLADKVPVLHNRWTGQMRWCHVEGAGYNTQTFVCTSTW